MPNQRDIARALGVNQATVSLALRGDRSVSERTQRLVRETAARMGYRPNAYVSSLMTHIRSGRLPSEEGVIAVLVEARSEREWHRIESYKIFHDGVVQRASELGFRIECFFLRAPGMSDRVIDRILDARGIQAVVLAPPYRGNRALDIRWERYACVGMGHSWEVQQFDRIANDHAQNVLLAFDELSRLGYRRIGMLLHDEAAVGGKGLKWLAGYLQAQNRLPQAQRIPLFTSGGENGNLQKFKRWLHQYRPDVLLAITGWEKAYLDALGLRVPEDIGMACLVRPRQSIFAGIDEKNEIIGATAIEFVASQIARNEFGVPQHPKLTLIDGRWVPGASVMQQPGTHRDELSKDCSSRRPARKKHA